ncbi:hypothetical protein BN7_6078 [Wickerhamomyces ciferrii]|uniref:Genetic interactor of prohibitin 5, mitochondrial n=1 Tax=Wickerhamomyces ciferrii (strain ATCC 14091 / BCRC 22168 / CBS 111 / JCM 3599 / NBRC 0793 / NRRL Y-1031 F-60-10) TaxID=1206466 RepID=K0KMI0_WICCF|nr:uncharacterized protein BN7_6078 [Wickerhamomyces ciferrii]CCH46485.1 hypothetical protein BN7_6078 [Wickerhamomyces ciferrii]
MHLLKSKILKQINLLPLDHLTKQKLVDQSNNYIKKNHQHELKIIDNLTSDVLKDKYSSITPLLHKAHDNVFYKGHEYIRHFLRFEIPTWIEHDYKERMLKGKSLDGIYKNDKLVSKLTFPRPSRALPSVSSIISQYDMKFGQQRTKENNVNVDVEPCESLSSPPKKHVEKYEFYDQLVRHVFRLINFLSGNTVIHNKNVKLPMVYIPPNFLGGEIPLVRKKNLIKRHITYLRNIIQQIPPLQKQDLEFLLNYTDNTENFKFDDDKSKD